MDEGSKNIVSLYFNEKFIFRDTLRKKVPSDYGDIVLL